MWIFVSSWGDNWQDHLSLAKTPSLISIRLEKEREKEMREIMQETHSSDSVPTLFRSESLCLT